MSQKFALIRTKRKLSPPQGVTVDEIGESVNLFVYLACTILITYAILASLPGTQRYTRHFGITLYLTLFMPFWHYQVFDVVSKY